MKTKIFEGDTVLNCLKQLLKEGYRPATLQEVWKAREEGKIPERWYDTGTIFKYGEFKFKKATIKELKNIEKMYEKGWRLAFLGGSCNVLVGSYNLYGYGRFFGVKSGRARNKKFRLRKGKAFSRATKKKPKKSGGEENE